MPSGSSGFMFDSNAATGQRWLETMFVFFIGMLALCGAFFVFASIYKMFVAYLKGRNVRQLVEIRQRELAICFPRPQLHANEGAARENERNSLAHRFSKHLLVKPVLHTMHTAERLNLNLIIRVKGRGRDEVEIPRLLLVMLLVVLPLALLPPHPPVCSHPNLSPFHSQLSTTSPFHHGSSL